MGALYKYRACGVNTDKIFTTGCLHYSNPKDFNDPYDCIAYLDKSKVFYNEGVGLFADKQIKKIQHIYSNDSLEQIFQSVFAKTEIYCLSKDGKQMQMWAHYAKNHTGICLEFDDDLLCNSLGNMFKVDYQQEQYKIILKDPHTMENDMLGVFCTKEKGWAYEKEIRMLRRPTKGHEDKNYPFDKKALKAIYFGSHCTPRNIRRYKRLCRLNGFEHVKFFQMRLANNGKFELEAIAI